MFFCDTSSRHGGRVAKKNVPFLPVPQNDDEDFNYVIAFFLGTAACLYQVSDSLR